MMTITETIKSRENLEREVIQEKNRNLCVPKQKVGFLKTHKCASSSVQNILLRYAIKHKLNVVLPEQNNYLGYDKQFSSRMLANTVWEKANLNYHIFLCHTRWNHREISQVLNRNGNDEVFYFSILRDPVMLYQSYWDYYGLAKQFNKTLDEYAKSVITNDIKYQKMTKKPPGYNQMLTDFGMNFHSMINEEPGNNSLAKIKENVLRKVQEIDKTFDIILLADEDYFDDGIILLKHALCWKYEDMVNVKRNVFSINHKSKLSSQSRMFIKGKTTTYK